MSNNKNIDFSDFHYIISLILLCAFAQTKCAQNVFRIDSDSMLSSVISIEIDDDTSVIASADDENDETDGNDEDDDDNDDEGTETDIKLEMYSDSDDKPIVIVDGEEIPADQPPSKQCVNGLYVPSASNCSSFLVCDNDQLKEVNCPPYMWFDPNYKGDTLCNYPEVVCASDNSICNCASEYPPLEPDPLIESSVSCLADNRFHFSGSNVDCGRYFICFNENVRRMECRTGFQYNANTEMCDYPELVNCRVCTCYFNCFIKG